MGNQPGSEEGGRETKKSKSKQKLKIVKEKDLSVEELAALQPYLEKQAEHFEKRLAFLDAGQNLDREYGSLIDGQGATSLVSDAPENVNKNRYRNITAYDHSRVHVTPLPENGNSDYINANWISGFQGPKSFIATQGPVPESIFSFWQMVWETEASVIVMLTNEVEGGKLKCHRYWPDLGAPWQVESIVLALEEETPRSAYVTRKITLEYKGEKRNVYHVQYTAWPDHGVPNTAAGMLRFRKVVHKQLSAGTPCIVHCSAGVGRSGTFIALETLMCRAESMSEDLDPRPYVCEMRRSRNFMVQTTVQYKFIFTAMLSALDKSMKKTKRALKRRRKELTKAEMEADDKEEELEELEEEIVEATEESEAIAADGDELLEGLRTLGRRAGVRFKADAVYSPFAREEDIKVATAVPRDVRVQSLAKAVTTAEQIWRSEGTVAEKGYKADKTKPIESRMSSLAKSATTDWKHRLKKMSEAWVRDPYDVRASLNPIESRMASLAAQREAWSMRSDAFKKTVEEEKRSLYNSLSNRLENLASSVTAMENVMKAKDGDDTLVRAADISLHDRLDALKDNSKKKRTPNEGRIVEDPRAVAHRKKVEEEKRQEEARRLAEEAKPKPPPEPPRPKTPEAPAKEEKKEVPTSPELAFPTIELKKTERDGSDEKVHPMISQAMQLRNSKSKLK